MNKIVKRSKRFMSLLLLSIMILSMSIPVVYAQAAPVSDIQNHWAKQEISAWIEKGFIEGYPDGTFKPNNTISRAEFISLVNRLFAYSEKALVPFTDVKESDWFYAEFAKASKAGYLDGYEDGKIEPDGFITRQEVAIISAKVKSLPEAAAEANSFADAAMIPDGSKGFIGAVTKAKVMNGYPDGKFEPTKSITRAESVITLNRLANLKNTVEIEAIKDKSISAKATYPVTIKVLTADAKVSVQSSDVSIVQATLADNKIQLKGIKVGTAIITVTGKKDGMLDGVVTFKVTVGPAVSSSGGSGGHSGGGTNPPVVVVPDEAALTNVKAIGITTTKVSGNYGTGVIKVEVIYNNRTTLATLINGAFSCSITPGLAAGTDVTVKGYLSAGLVDTDVVKVVEAPVVVVPDENALTNVKAIGTTITEVTGNYGTGVIKAEVIYNNVTTLATLTNGAFSCSITPGLAAGTDITVKGYLAAGLVDTDVVKVVEAPVVEDDTKLTYVQAIGTIATAVTGNYAEDVTRVEVIYSGLTKTATLNSNGTFSWSIFPGLSDGTSVTVKGYIGTDLVDTDVVEVGVEAERPYLSDVKAVGTIATAVTGKYNSDVTKVEVIYTGLTKTATLNDDGTFSWSIFPGLLGGTTVTIKAYVGSQLVATEVIVTPGEPIEGSYLTNVKAVGTVATAVTGEYADSVTKVEVIFSGLTKTATLNTDGTFSWSIFPGLASGAEVIVKAYVGALLVETETIYTPGEPGEISYISEVKAVGTIATAVTGEYIDTVTKVEVLYNNLTKTATLNSDGTFSWSIFPGLVKGAEVTVNAYVGTVLKDTVVVNVQ